MIASRLQDFVRQQLPTVLGLALFLCVALLSEQTLQMQRHSEEMAATIEHRSDLYTVREQIDQTLSALIFRTLGLIAYIQAKSGDIDEKEVEAILAALHANSPHIRNFGLAKDTKIILVYPEASNRAALGVDYRDLPAQWPDVESAMGSSQGVLAGPVQLVQGGTALIFRFPVRVEGEYWGLLSTVIDVDSYMNSIASIRLFAEGNLSIRTMRNDIEVLLFGTGSAFENQNSQRVEISVPGGRWELAIDPEPDTAYPLLNTLRLVGWSLGLLLGIGVATILHQRRALQRLALVDGLTGVANRRQFDLLLKRFCEKYDRRNSGSFAVLYLDLDKFKEINDQHGHRAGDYFLVELSKRAQSAIRGGDLLARWGGDEFAIILDNPSPEKIIDVVARVLSLCEQPVRWREENIIVSASVGVVRYPDDGRTPEQLVSTADQRMYENKRLRQKQAIDNRTKK